MASNKAIVAASGGMCKVSNRSSSKKRVQATGFSPSSILQSTDPSTEVALKKYMNSLRSQEDRRIQRQ